MFYYQSHSLEPNLINCSAEEEECNNKAKTRLFRDMKNLQQDDRANDKLEPQVAERKESSQQLRGDLEQKGQENAEEGLQNEVRKTLAEKRTKVIMEFSSQDENELPEQPVSSPLPQIPIKNRFLLAFEDDQQQQEERAQQILQKNCQKNGRKTSQHMTVIPQSRNKLLLNFDDDSDEESGKEEDTTRPPSKKITKSLLNSLLLHSKEKYYAEAIQPGETMQCVIKRERGSHGIKYQIYDSTTLTNFMSVLKSEDGYIFISRYEPPGNSNLKIDTVVAKLTSNFFGTEFSCYLCNSPYRRFGEYPISPDKDEQTMTIEYETNLFGLKGPRRMTAYIPSSPKGIASKKSLNQLYESEKKKKVLPTVKKYKNKTPKWNKTIEAYVLNFYGRATISSIKNFIMIHENQNIDSQARVLFGKYGKDLFNLDISHPFSLIQGIALALSSFDKKLACE